MLTVLSLDPSLDCGELGPLIEGPLSSVEDAQPCLTAEEWSDLRASEVPCPRLVRWERADAQT